MKRCPECRRDYYDDSLQYCLEDGVALVQGLVPDPIHGSDQPATAILHETAESSEAATRFQVHTTDQTVVQPSSGANVPAVNGFDKRLLAVPLVLAAIVLGGIGLYRYSRSSESGSISSVAVLPFEN